MKRNDSEPISVLHSDIVGKVISVVWRGTPQAAEPESSEKSAALNRSGPVFPSAIEASPITSPVTGGDESPAGIAAAQKLGIAAATKDIQAGNFRILGYGVVTQIVDSPVDEETGYRIQYVAGSFLGNAFRAECDAYNFAMREHHQKHKPSNLKQLTTPQDPFATPQKP